MVSADLANMDASEKDLVRLYSLSGTTAKNYCILLCVAGQS